MISLDLARLEGMGELGRALISGLPGAGVLVVDAELRILLVDGEAFERTPLPEAIGRRVPDVADPRLWEILGPRYDAALDGQTDVFDLDAPDFGFVHRIRMVPVRDGAIVAGVLVLTQDVTGQERARRELAGARDFLQATLDSLPAHVAVVDAAGEILMVNRAWVAFGERAGSRSGVGENYFAACAAAAGDPHADRAAAGLRAVVAGDTASFCMEYPCHAPDGERWFVLRATRFDGPGSARAVVAHDDVTERRLAEREVATHAALLDEVDVAVIATDAAGHVTHWNRGAESLYGWTREEAVGRSAGELIVPASNDSAAEIVTELRRVGHWEGHFTVARKDGTCFPAYVRDRLIDGGDGHPAGMVGVSVDVSDQVASERALAAARNYLSAVTDSMGEGLFALDVDGRVTYMNQAAEELLGWTADELRGQVLHDLAHVRRADGTAMPMDECQILRARRDGTTVRVEDDRFVRRDGHEFDVAYTAAPFVTDDGIQGCVVVFEDISERKAREAELRREADTLAWIGRVSDALADDRFMLYGQPIVDLASGAVVQCELLLRLRESDGRIVAPAEYLHIAEQYGQIDDIDRWVIRRATQIAATGRPVEVNVSGRSIGDPSMLEHLERCIAEAGADPTLLVFEVTETAMVQDEAAAGVFARHVRELGCKVALDDFGTGFGGFTYLKQLPVDYLKIDIEFVRDLVDNPASRHVVHAVVSLARSFELQTIAEGVEDAPTLELLRELGVDFAQGYHLGRPAPIDGA